MLFYEPMQADFQIPVEVLSDAAVKWLWALDGTTVSSRHISGGVSANEDGYEVQRGPGPQVRIEVFEGKAS